MALKIGGMYRNRASGFTPIWQDFVPGSLQYPHLRSRPYWYQPRPIAVLIHDEVFQLIEIKYVPLIDLPEYCCGTYIRVLAGEKFGWILIEDAPTDLWEQIFFEELTPENVETLRKERLLPDNDD